MFVKVTPRKKNGKTYYYAELVESYRKNGKVKHKRILYFGSVDLETAKRLKIAFSKDFDSFTNIDKVDFPSAVPFGNYYLLDKICSQLNLFEFLKNNFTSSNNHISVNTAVDCIKAMIFQRIIQPDSKLGLVDNFDLTPLEHFLSYNKINLQSLYRSLNVLEENFAIVEKYVYELAVKKFKQDDKELFYDITSSYFEGHKCIISKFGYSRDKRRDCKQIVIGLVTTSFGFPIKCNIYPGNTSDKTTVIKVIKQLKRDYPIDEVIFVGDRGMITAKNIEAIDSLKQKYVMAIPRRWSKKYLKKVKIKEKKMEKVENDLYAKFISSCDDEKFLLCLNVQKRKDDREYRKNSIRQIINELNQFNKNMGNNKNIKTRDDAMKKAGAISKLNKCGRYFNMKTVNDSNSSLGFSIEYELKKKQIQEDKRLDGTFLIQTNKVNYSKKKLLKVYKNLSKVENAFRIIKNDLDIRPMYHRKEDRVKGHVYICFIAYFIFAAIEYISKKNKLNKSGRKILNKLSKIKLIEILLPNGDKKYSLTSIEKDLKEMLKSYKIKKVEVPQM